MTVAILVGCAACFLLKWLGYVVPGHWLEGRVTARVTALLPVALLSALMAVQAFTTGGRVVLDARAVAVAVAAALLALRAGFVVVVVTAAVVAAGLRALGVG